MKKNEFKIGDRVRCIETKDLEDTGGGAGFYPGREFIIYSMNAFRNIAWEKGNNKGVFTNSLRLIREYKIYKKDRIKLKFLG